jgi:hypothetical protein
MGLVKQAMDTVLVHAPRASTVLQADVRPDVTDAIFICQLSEPMTPLEITVTSV